MDMYKIVITLPEPIAKVMGGWERELYSVGKMLEHTHDVQYCVDSFPDRCDILVTIYCANVKAKRVCYHVFHDRASLIPNNVDLVLTDTQRGKTKYEGMGYKATPLYPVVNLGGYENKRASKKLLFVGSIHVGKRPDLAIEAMKGLPDYTLHIIGSTYHSTKAEWNARWVEDYPSYCKSICGKNVIWRGELTYRDLIIEMQNAEMCIIPYCSDNEFNTNVALECLANGCVPLIAEGLVDYFNGDEGIFLSNQRELTSSDITEAIKSLNSKEISVFRANCWRTATDIWRYCNTEVKDAICAI